MPRSPPRPSRRRRSASQRSRSCCGRFGGLTLSRSAACPRPSPSYSATRASTARFNGVSVCARSLRSRSALPRSTISSPSGTAWGSHRTCWRAAGPPCTPRAPPTANSSCTRLRILRFWRPRQTRLRKATSLFLITMNVQGPAEARVLFAKFGTDRTDRLPYDLFVHMLLARVHTPAPRARGAVLRIRCRASSSIHSPVCGARITSVTLFFLRPAPLVLRACRTARRGRLRSSTTAQGRTSSAVRPEPLHSSPLTLVPSFFL